MERELFHILKESINQLNFKIPVVTLYTVRFNIKCYKIVPQYMVWYDMI